MVWSSPVDLEWSGSPCALGPVEKLNQAVFARNDHREGICVHGSYLRVRVCTVTDQGEVGIQVRAESVWVRVG